MMMRMTDIFYEICRVMGKSELAKMIETFFFSRYVAQLMHFQSGLDSSRREDRGVKAQVSQGPFWVRYVDVDVDVGIGVGIRIRMQKTGESCDLTYLGKLYYDIYVIEYMYTSISE